MKIYKIGFMIVVILLVCLSFAVVITRAQTNNQQNDDSEDIETLRNAQIIKWGGNGLPDHKKVAALAQEILAKPLDNQTVSELTELAEQANRAANYINFIESEYDSYHREKRSYDFITEPVGKTLDEYRIISNQLKDYRNQSYFNLGKKADISGNKVKAFFYFRDAYRLAIFARYKEFAPYKEVDMRYKAEQEMKRMLNLEDIESFKYYITY